MVVGTRCFDFQILIVVIMDFESFQKFILQIIENMPEEWLGTTFKNDAVSYVGRESFTSALLQLLSRKSSQLLTTGDLETVGNAEDYLRGMYSDHC